MFFVVVVLDTTKVQIFKQITTVLLLSCLLLSLFQIPQRYRFSSKSQRVVKRVKRSYSCFRYHKGTDFQANHNKVYDCRYTLIVVLDTTKVQIFKQITTERRQSNRRFWLFQIPQRYRFSSKSQLRFRILTPDTGCFRYHKGTDFQANHNYDRYFPPRMSLFQIPQRYRFSSKSQPSLNKSAMQSGCFRYHKGTDFQANHNKQAVENFRKLVVLDTTKVQIFKQITTRLGKGCPRVGLFQIPQRYRFSSKSQL